jgi:hypothetical protein
MSTAGALSLPKIKVFAPKFLFLQTGCHFFLQNHGEIRNHLIELHLAIYNEKRFSEKNFLAIMQSKFKK